MAVSAFVCLTVLLICFLPHDALQCKAWSCYRMSSVCPSVCLSVYDVGGSWPQRLQILETTVDCANN